MTLEEKNKAIQEFCQNRIDGNNSCNGCPLDTICAEILGFFDENPDKTDEAYAIITGQTEHYGCYGCKYMSTEAVDFPCRECKNTHAIGSTLYKRMPDMYEPAMTLQAKSDAVKEYCNTSLEPNVDRYEIHKKLCIGLNDLYVRKNHDYGNTFGDGFKEYGLIMPVIRLEDKFNRIKQLALHPEKQQVKDESIVDTLRDLANYALMTITEMEINNHENKD